MHIYLSTWEQYNDGAPGVAYRPVAGIGGWLGGVRDLRVDASQPVGYCLLARSDRLPDPLPAGVIYLGTPNERPGVQTVMAIEAVLGISPPTLRGKTVQGMVVALAFDVPNNGNFQYTPRPRKDGITRLLLGNEVLYAKRTHPPRPATTEITESFNCTPDAALSAGCDLAWVPLVNPDTWHRDAGLATVTVLNASSHYTADSPLDSSDTQCEITISTFTRVSGFLQMAPVCRCPVPANLDITTADGYFIMVYYEDTPQVVYALRIVTNGVRSDLTSGVNITLSLPEVWRVEANGNELQAYRDGVPLFSPAIEDSTHPTGQYAGLYGTKAGGAPSGTLQISGWAARDIPAGANIANESKVAVAVSMMP